MAIWLGLNKLGCVTALINYNLREDALRHAITVADSRAVIVGVDLLDNYLAVRGDLKDVKSAVVFCEGEAGKYNAASGLPCLDEEIAKMPTTKPVVPDPPRYFDKLYYIYTSGTTGLPKPCVITSHRAYVYAMGHHRLVGMTDTDVLYCTLPLYHRYGIGL